MKLDRETRTQIAAASPGSTTITWPLAEGPPERGRLYRVLALEESRRLERRRRAETEAPEPTTMREVMAEMHRRYYGDYPEGYEPPRRRRFRRRSDRMVIRVLSVVTTQDGWDVDVELASDRPSHTGLKTRVPAGPHPIFGHREPVELEPEQIVAAPTRSEREDERESLRIESAASIDRAELNRLERRVAQEARRGRPARRSRQALARARQRVERAEAA